MGSGNSTDNGFSTELQLARNCAEIAKIKEDIDIQESINEYRKAIDLLKGILKNHSRHSATSKDLLIQNYMDIAILYEKQKNFEAAKDCYQEAKKLGELKADSKLKELIAKIALLDIRQDNIKLYFTNNPPACKPREYQSSYDDVKDTSCLAGFLMKVNNDSLEYRDLKKLALMVIEVFAKEQVKTKESINEVTMLAISENEEIIRELLGQFIQIIRDQVLLNEHLLNGLAEILRHANPALLNSDDLTKVLVVIHEKLNSLHQQGSESKLLSLIQSIAKVLAAMADANVEGLNRVEQHEPLYDSLSALVGTVDSDFHCRQAALYARQALVRVPNDESKLQSAIRRIIKIGQGLNSLNEAFQQKSPSELLNAFNSFKEAFKYQVRQKPWYDALRYAQLLIECNHFTGFEEFINKSEYYSQEGMLYGIVFLLKSTIETHNNLDIRCSALELLTHIWGEQGKLEFKLRDQVREAFNQRTMFQDGEYVGLHKDIIRCIAEILLASSRNSNQRIKQTALKLIERLKQTSSKLQQNILEEIISTNYQELETFSITESGYPVELLNIAKKLIRERRPSLEVIKEQIDRKFVELKRHILNDKELQDELAVYIPVNGSYERHANQDANTFDLATKIQELFTDASKKVLLLLGSAGIGKSTFNRYLERSLWEQYQKDDPIPLFISLPSLANPESELIQEYFRTLPPNCSFNEQEIEILQREYKFIFILDAYDEINKLSNLYLKNHLEHWQAKIIISCRTDYLTGIANNDTKIFMPYIGGKPSYQSFMEISVVPFSDAQITAYITKYLAIHKDNPDKDLPWKNAQEYEEQIAKIPGLKQLIKTPFLLMVAMDVMPQIVERYASLEGQERTNITRARLLDEFVQQLFEREEDKLMVEGKLPADGSDVKEDFWAFAMELAVAMHELATNDVYYAPQSSSLFGGNRNISPWEKFFGTPTDSNKAERLIRARNGCNCVLRTIGKHRRAFIHATLQDYFVIRKIKLDEEQSAHSMPAAFTPFYSKLANSELQQETFTSELEHIASSSLTARI